MAPFHGDNPLKMYKVTIETANNSLCSSSQHQIVLNKKKNLACIFV